MTRVIFFIFLASSIGAQQRKVIKGNRAQVVSVCDVVMNRLKYDGQLINVRGVVLGTEEGMWIAAPGKCTPGLTTFGYSWPDIIWVAPPDSPGRLHDVDFQLDLRNLEQIDQQIRAMNVDPSKDRVWLTVSGLFETRVYEPTGVSTSGRGNQGASGFGHMNSAPGQLLVKGEEDPVVERDVLRR